MHELRAASDAVAVGMGTVRLENPRLDARDVAATRQPRRLAFGTGPLPEGSELELRSGPLEEELRALAAEGVQSLLLEGGPTLAAAFLRAGLVDKLLLFVAPTLAGAGPVFVDALDEPLDARAPHEPRGRGGRPARGVSQGAVSERGSRPARPRPGAPLRKARARTQLLLFGAFSTRARALRGQGDDRPGDCVTRSPPLEIVPDARASARSPADARARWHGASATVRPGGSGSAGRATRTSRLLSSRS